MFEGDLEAAVLEQRGGAIVCWFIGDRPCDWEGDRDRTRWILKEQQPQHSEDWGPHHPWGERRHFLEGEEGAAAPFWDARSAPLKNEIDNCTKWGFYEKHTQQISGLLQHNTHHWGFSNRHALSVSKGNIARAILDLSNTTRKIFGGQNTHDCRFEGSNPRTTRSISNTHLHLKEVHLHGCHLEKDNPRT